MAAPTSSGSYGGGSGHGGGGGHGGGHGGGGSPVSSQAEAWGTNTVGQLGVGTVGDAEFRPTAVTVAGPHTVRSVSAGSDHGLALLSNGTVKAWGSNEFGQLGDGTETTRPIPGSVAGLGDVKAVAAGGYFNLALLQDGTLRSWGLNFSGQLGDGTTSNRSLPVKVAGLPGRVTAIAAGDATALALLADGTVMAWGSNTNGQLGQGAVDSGPHPIPLEVSLPQRATSVGAGLFHSLAVLADGSVRGRGANFTGQLGIGNNVSPQPSPVDVIGLTGVTAVAAGYDGSSADGHSPRDHPGPRDGLGREPKGSARHRRKRVDQPG